MRGKRLLFSAFLTLLLLFALFNSFSLFQFNENVKRALLSRAAPFISGGLSIDRVSLGPGTVHLRGIELKDRRSGARLYIRDLKITLDLVRLFTTRFDFGRSVSRIEFNRPTLTLSTAPDRAPVLTSPSRPSAQDGGAPPAGFSELDITRFPIDTILIRRGAIALRDSALRFLRIDDIRGLLTVRDGRPTFDLSGNLFNAEKRILIEGSTASDFREFDLTAFLDHASLAEPAPLADGLTLNKGNLRFTLRASKPRETPLALTDISGLFSLSHVRARLPGGFTLEDFSGELRIQNHGLTLEHCVGKILGKPFTLTGSLDNLFAPNLALTLDCPELPLAHAEIPRSLAALKPWGSLTLRAAAAGPPGNLRVRGELSSSKIGLAGYTLSQPRAAFSVARDTLTLLRATARVLSGALTLEGRLPLRKPDQGRFTADLRGFDPLPPKSPATRASTFDAHIAIDPGTPPNIQATLSGGLIDQPALDQITGSLRSKGSTLEFAAQNRNRGLVLTGTTKNWTATNRDTRAKFKIRGMNKSWLSGFTSQAGRPDPVKTDGEIALSFTGERLKILADLSMSGSLTSGKLYATGQFLPPWKQPVFSIKAFSDSFALAGSPGSLELEFLGRKGDYELRNFRLAKIIRADVKASPSALTGDVAIQGLSLTPALIAAMGVEALSDSRAGGFIDGQIRLSGAPDRPEYAASLALRQGVLGRLSPLNLHLSLSGGPGRLVLRGLKAETPAQRFLHSDSLKIENGRLSGALRVINFPLSDLSEDSLRLSGKVSLDLVSHNGHSDITAALDNVRFRRVHFGYLKASLTERNGVATINRLQFGNPNLTGEAVGFVPLPWSSSGAGARSDTLSLILTAKGDFLKELAGVTGVFKDRFGARTTGNGDLRLRFSGAGGRYLLSDGYLDITRDKSAMLYPVKVLDKVTRFKGRIAFHGGRAAVDLDGLIEGNRLRILNEPRWGREENLTLEKMGLDFGVLRVITGPGGIQANAPTIIPAGEKGDFELFDPQGNPGIIVAGPLHHPTVLGSMRIHNCRFTYPFLTESDEPGPGPPITWAITIMAGNNLKYYYNERKFSPMPYLNKIFKSKALKGISNFIEYPFTELTLDRSSALTLKGAVDHHEFTLLGRITSSRGYVHYAGQDFRNDIDVGVEFDGRIHQPPIIWGTATTTLRPENRSEVGREVRLTLYVKDPKTGTEVPKGRFTELRLVPSSDSPFEDGQNKSSSAYQDMLGQDFSRNPDQVTAFARSEGKAMFEKVFLQRMITNYVERTVLSLGRQTLNPLFGRDVTPDVFRIEIESDKIFNYIDMSAWSFNQFKKDFIENAEFITGKYFLGGSLFLNYSSQLDVARDPEGVEFEKLHHRLGVELTPWRYLYFNMDYEIGGIPKAMTGELNPGDFRSNIRLRLPFKLIQDAFTPEDTRKETGKP